MKYIAEYMRYGERLEKKFGTAKKAAQFLLDGEKTGQLSYIGVKNEDGDVYADSADGIAYEPLYELGAKE